MQALAIVALSILAAVSYGIVHDQITARVCVEYFTIGHPQVLAVPTDSPTVLGFVWGVIATWWVGLGLGIPLALAARLGSPAQEVRTRIDSSLVRVDGSGWRLGVDVPGSSATSLHRGIGLRCTGRWAGRCRSSVMHALLPICLLTT